MYSVVVGYQRFRCPCCLQLQGEVKMETVWTSDTLVSYHNALHSRPTAVKASKHESNRTIILFFYSMNCLLLNCFVYVISVLFISHVNDIFITALMDIKINETSKYKLCCKWEHTSLHSAEYK